MYRIDDCECIEDLIDFLVKQTPQRTTQEACADALLVFEFFPTLGPEFQRSPEITEDQLERFKNDFDYSKIGVDRDVALGKVKDITSITKVIDTLVELISQEIKEELMRVYLAEVWYKQNSNGDLNHFKQNLNRDYWLS